MFTKPQCLEHCDKEPFSPSKPANQLEGCQCVQNPAWRSVSIKAASLRICMCHWPRAALRISQLMSVWESSPAYQQLCHSVSQFKALPYGKQGCSISKSTPITLSPSCTSPPCPAGFPAAPADHCCCSPTPLDTPVLLSTPPSAACLEQPSATLPQTQSWLSAC